MAETGVDDQIYQPHSRYRLMAGVSTLLFLALSWNLLAPVFRGRGWLAVNMDVGLLFFMAVSLGIALWYLRLSFARVEVSAESVTLRMPLSRPQSVTYQQLAGVSVSHRAGRPITLLFHPKGRAGLVDPDEIASLTLPELADQETLLADLEGQTPP